MHQHNTQSQLITSQGKEMLRYFAKNLPPTKGKLPQKFQFPEYILQLHISLQLFFEPIYFNFQEENI